MELINPGPPEPRIGSYIEPTGWRQSVAFYPGLDLEEALRRWAKDTGAAPPRRIIRGAAFAGAVLNYNGQMASYLALPETARGKEERTCSE